MKSARLLVLAGLIAAVLTAGCVVARPSGVSAETSQALKTPPALQQDYAGWTLDPDQKVSVADVVMPISGNQLRQERATVLRSPTGDMRILASYARSGANADEVANKPWKTLDAMFRSDGWKRPEAQALHRQMLADHPKELILGAYGVSGSTGRYYVGFYRQNGSAWVRGEHVYEFDAGRSSWQQVAEDGKSGDFWDALVAVP